MLGKRKHKKIAAIFCLVTFLQSIVLPPMAHALTSGPTSPEATSFEPVDTTDMVNLQTGDFTYNMPLLEVPGPEGGYPISLAYHGGIKPLEEASWVGLGWSLSPGAINRTVNGFPDDANGQNREVLDFWEGGRTKTFSASVGVGVSGAATLGLGISISDDTYKGSDVGLSINGQVRAKGGLGVGFSVGGGSGSSISASGSIGYSSVQGNNIGINGSTDFKGNNGYGISAKSGLVSMGASLNAGQLKGSASLGGISGNVYNSNYGKISTSGGGINIPIQFPGTPFNANLGYSYQKYWMSELDNVYAYGTLNGKTASLVMANKNLPTGGPENISFDSYSIPHLEKPLEDSDEVLGGSLPAFDSYQVLGQGIGGTFRPFFTEQASLFRQKREIEENNTTVVKNNFLIINDFSKDVNFKFDNDFSNKFEFTGTPGASGLVLGPFVGHLQGYGFKSHNLGYSSIFSTEGYKHEDQHLAGSKHIEWFMNWEIESVAGTKGFIKPGNWSLQDAKEINNEYFPQLSTQIGGFSVTNESGVTYHYGLPAYSYDEYSESYDESRTQGDSYNKQFKPAPYAYTWHLTAITGPDYIDRSPTNNEANGVLDNEDLGYWVEFDYGEWADEYMWRDPANSKSWGDISLAKTFSYGKKEIYYLDAIRTRTHTALFVKEIREDGKGVNQPIEGGIVESGYDIDMVKCSQTCTAHPIHSGQCPATSSNCRVIKKLDGFRPGSLMKLNKILLLKNESISQSLSLLKVESAFTSFNPVFSLTEGATIEDNCELECICNGIEPYTNTTTSCGNFRTLQKVYNDANVIDVLDISNSIEQNAIKSIEFDTDYSLCPETSNSFSNDFYSGGNFPTERGGKLTLNSLKYKGKQGFQYLPSLKFNYELENPKTANSFSISTSQTFGKVDIDLFGTSNNFDVGDIVHFKNASNQSYYGVLMKPIGSGNSKFEIASLGKNSFYAGMPTGTIEQTINPPFNENLFDFWGNYKSDIGRATTGSVLSHISEQIRRPTNRSSKAIEAWSLRKIKTSLGSDLKIQYEPKSYQNVALVDNNKLLIKSVTYNFQQQHQYQHQFKVIFNDNIDLTQNFSPGDQVKVAQELIRKASNCVLRTCTFVKDNIPVIDVFPDYLVLDYSNLYDLNCGQLHGTVDFEEGLVCIPPGNNQTIGYGDGVRVKKVQLISNGQLDQETRYNYPNSTTSYVPFQPRNFDFEINTACPPPGTEQIWLNAIKNEFKAIAAKSRFVPPPGVMNTEVEVQERAKNGLLKGRRKYTFSTFDESMLSINYSDYDEYTSTNFIGEKQTITINDKTSQIGNLTKIEDFNSFNHLISEVTNVYATSSSDYSKYNNQGVIEEVYHEVNYRDDYSYRRGVVTVKNTFPAPLMESITTSQGNKRITKYHDYDFYTGAPTQVENINSFGESFVKVDKPAYQIDDFYGNIAPGASNNNVGMGLKVHNPNNKNMLTQNAYSKLYRADANGNEIGNPISASVTTWNKDWEYREFVNNEFVDDSGDGNPNTGNSLNDDPLNDVWRKHKSYTYKTDLDPDGTFANNYTDFTHWDPTTTPSSEWLKTMEVTRYDHYSKPLEECDINGNFAAAKMGYDQTLPLAAAAPAKYVEFAFSGAEKGENTDYFYGEVKRNSAKVYSNSLYLHTGDYCQRLTSSRPEGFSYTAEVNSPTGTDRDKIDRKRYEAMVWVRTNNLQDNLDYLRCDFYDSSGNIIPGTTIGAKKNDPMTIKAGDWYLLRLPIDLSASNSNLSGVAKIKVGTYSPASKTIYMDDFRFAPEAAGMTSYVYDQETDQVRFILGDNHLFTEYQYDEAGRLKRVYQETTENPTGKRLVTDYDYNYKRDEDQ